MAFVARQSYQRGDTFLWWAWN